MILTVKIDEDETTWAEAFGKESDTVWPCETTMIIEYLYFIWDKIRRLKSLHYLGKLQSVSKLLPCGKSREQTQKKEESAD